MMSTRTRYTTRCEAARSSGAGPTGCAYLVPIAEDQAAHRAAQVYKTVCKVLKPAEGQERPSGAALEEIRRGIVDKLNAIEQMQGRSAHLGRQVYQVVEAQARAVVGCL